jgi:hypothetical protein
VEGPVVTVTADDAAGTAFTTSDDLRLAESQPRVKVLRIAEAGTGFATCETTATSSRAT